MIGESHRGTAMTDTAELIVRLRATAEGWRNPPKMQWPMSGTFKVGYGNLTAELYDQAAEALAAQAQEIERWKNMLPGDLIARVEAAEARVRELDQQWREHCQKIHDEAHEIHGGTGKVIADLKAERDAIEVKTIERCRIVALEQRCERGTPWDRACVTIAEQIRNLKVPVDGK